MTAKDKSLEALLFEAGYAEEFVEYAVRYEDVYRGDLKKFVDYIEHLAQNDAENELRADSDATALIDSGSKRVEHDYTGDNLTHGGYDHTDDNRRW